MNERQGFRRSQVDRAIIHKGTKAGRAMHVMRLGQGLKVFYGIVQRLLQPGEELMMPHDTRSSRTSSTSVALYEGARRTRELVRVDRQGDGVVFQLFSQEPIVVITPEIATASRSEWLSAVTYSEAARHNRDPRVGPLGQVPL